MRPTSATAVLVVLFAASSARPGEEPAAAPPPAAPVPLVHLGTNAQGAEEWWRAKDGAVVIRVPGGAFLRRPYEGTVATAEPKPVEVASFLVDKHEVTNARFARFLTACPDAASFVRAEVPGLVRTDAGWAAAPGLENHPVTACTGRGALAFAAWAGARLPTAPEWEKAAGGAEGRLWPWGDETPDARHANYGRPSPRGPEPVGSHPLGASPFGALDMAGNAYERVLTKTRGGELLPVMVKGGSWVSPHPLNLRVLDLCMQSHEVADRTVGFRCVMDDPEPQRAPRAAAPRATLRWATDFDAAVAEARRRRVPVFLSLLHDTCGQCDRTRAQLYADPRFVAYCAERVVAIAGHVSGDALGDPHAANGDGTCPLYPGLTCAQHEELYARGLAVVRQFVVTPGNFVLDPDLVEKGAGEAAVLVGEREIPKWGDDVEAYLRAFDAAAAKLAAKTPAPAPALPADPAK